ncbi:MAG: endonuclease III domain-containing protein [Gammaproteobacteria bacterium]
MPKPVSLPSRRLHDIHARLLAHRGARHWWPADTPFEIMVGAILTQNTAWRNVERAIANLKAADALSPEAILAAPPETLADWLRPSGYFNVKARRLRNYCQWYQDNGGFQGLKTWKTAPLRAAVLSVNGVGPETADDIVLYAFDRPVFVIDTYTRRIFSRLGLIKGDEPYETLRAAFEQSLGPDAPLFNEYHAQIVGLGNQTCRPKPLCGKCPLSGLCPASAAG